MFSLMRLEWTHQRNIGHAAESHALSPQDLPLKGRLDVKLE